MLMNRDAVTIRPDGDSLERIDELVQAEVFPDRASATAFLLAEGIKRNSEVFDSIRGRVKEIRALKEQMAGGSREVEASPFAVKKAAEQLKEAISRYEAEREKTIHAGERLHQQRGRAASEVIERVEAYVSTLARSSKEFDKAVAEYRQEVSRFADEVERLETDAAQTAMVAGGAGAAGAVAGVGVAALGPTAALAIATTFGTASTGTAISALSGAAAANAALAWLGGGALATGGGGMAAGGALLALAGPIGWTLAGTAVAGGALFLHLRYRYLAETARKKRIAVEAGIRSLIAKERKIVGLAQRIAEHANGCLAELGWLAAHGPNDYRKFDVPQKERLAALINHILSLGKLLGEKVENESA